jgi:prepilin-type N-terminal cleavage/methylation domain-containing protein
MKKTNLKKSESGFSLIELLVALTIFFIVIGSVYGLLEVGRVERGRASRRSDSMKNGRVSLHLIGRDALNAGLSYTRFGAQVPDDFLSSKLNFSTDTNTTRDLLTSVVPGNAVNSTTLQADNTDMIAFVYRDVDFFGGASISVTNATAAPSNSNAVQLTTLENISLAGNPPTGTPPVQKTVPNRYDLFLAESDGVRAVVMLTNIADVKKLDFAPNDPLLLNQSLSGTSAQTVSLLRKCIIGSIETNCMKYPASLKRVFIVTYKVKSDGTLVRTTYGNNTTGTATTQIQEQPIAYGVKDLQIRYTTAGGISSDDPTFYQGTLDPARRNDVRQVTITLTAQDGIDEQTGKPNYVTLDGTFSTRNLEYDAG